ncbi:MAG: hypothetical protein ACRBB3_09150 [Alphaproteobacteria bacterium]
MPTLKWDIDKCLEQCRPTPLSNHYYTANIHPKRPQGITPIEIRKAYNQIAKIIAIHGEKYLPLFRRLHTEIIKHREKNELLDIAKSISKEDLSTNNISRN